MADYSYNLNLMPMPWLDPRNDTTLPWFRTGAEMVESALTRKSREQMLRDQMEEEARQFDKSYGQRERNLAIAEADEARKAKEAAEVSAWEHDYAQEYETAFKSMVPEMGEQAANEQAHIYAWNRTWYKAPNNVRNIASLNVELQKEQARQQAMETLKAQKPEAILNEKGEQIGLNAWSPNGWQPHFAPAGTLSGGGEELQGEEFAPGQQLVPNPDGTTYGMRVHLGGKRWQLVHTEELNAQEKLALGQHDASIKEQMVYQAKALDQINGAAARKGVTEEQLTGLIESGDWSNMTADQKKSLSDSYARYSGATRQINQLKEKVSQVFQKAAERKERKVSRNQPKAPENKPSSKASDWLKSFLGAVPPTAPASEGAVPTLAPPLSGAAPDIPFLPPIPFMR